MENDIIEFSNPYSKLMPESDIDNSIISMPTPKKLHSLYRLGMAKGVLLDDIKCPWYVRKFAKYNFDYYKDNQEDGQSIIFEDTKYYSAIKDSGKGKRVINNQYLLLNSKNGKGAQETGDCVSWAIRDALDQLRGNRILIDGEWEAFIERQATCGIYSYRGHNGQGADPVGLSAAAVKIGTLLEKKYQTDKNTYDFSNYSKYVNWGMSRGRSGMPSDLLEQTKPYSAGTYKVVATTEGLRDLMYAKGTAHCGSMIGVSSYGDPISRLSGSWAHDMNIYGYDGSGEFFDDCIWMFNQSWGLWNQVTNIPQAWLPIPEGAFFIKDRDMQQAINSGGTVCFFDGKFFDGEPIGNDII